TPAPFSGGHNTHPVSHCVSLGREGVMCYSTTAKKLMVWDHWNTEARGEENSGRMGSLSQSGGVVPQLLSVYSVPWGIADLIAMERVGGKVLFLILTPNCTVTVYTYAIDTMDFTATQLEGQR
ncbi:hypothetical protein KIPB_005363, partial [Kipferlia bialata]